MAGRLVKAGFRILVLLRKNEYPRCFQKAMDCICVLPYSDEEDHFYFAGYDSRRGTLYSAVPFWLQVFIIVLGDRSFLQKAVRPGASVVFHSLLELKKYLSGHLFQRKKVLSYA